MDAHRVRQAPPSQPERNYRVKDGSTGLKFVSHPAGRPDPRPGRSESADTQRWTRMPRLNPYFTGIQFRETNNRWMHRKGDMAR